jgi:hypothetical protein
MSWHWCVRDDTLLLQALALSTGQCQRKHTAIMVSPTHLQGHSIMPARLTGNPPHTTACCGHHWHPTTHATM